MVVPLTPAQDQVVTEEQVVRAQTGLGVIDPVVVHVGAPLADGGPGPALGRDQTGGHEGIDQGQADGAQLVIGNAEVFSGFPDIAAAAASCEAAGYGTFWAQEQNHDPVVAMAAASTSTRPSNANIIQMRCG